MKVFLLSLLFMGCVSAVTKEVVRVFQPVSYHGTDSVIEYGVKGDLIQAIVLDRALVLSGAFPEDLVKAVAMPFRLQSNNENYKVEEVNLMVLCGLDLEVTLGEGEVDVSINCSKFEIPEAIELTERQILTMTIEAIRRTLRVYYQEGASKPFECDLRLTELDEKLKALQSLDSKFSVGRE